MRWWSPRSSSRAERIDGPRIDEMPVPPPQRAASIANEDRSAAGSVSPVSGDGETDIVRLSQLLRRKWLWIAVPTVLVTVVVAVGVSLMTPRYTGEVRLLLESRDNFYTRPAADQRDTTTFDSEAVASQVQVITSRDLARAAIRKLNLVGNPEFDPRAGATGLLTAPLQFFGVRRSMSDGVPEDRLLDAFAEHLLVYPAGRSRVLIIEFRSRDPELAARGANTVAGLYLEGQELAKLDTTRSASTWLSSTIEPLRKRVTEAEAKVEDFRSKAGLLASGNNNTTLTTQQMSDLSGQLASARAAQADAQAKASLIRDLIRTNRAMDIPDVANNDGVRRLIEQRGTVSAQLALESRTLLPAHPRIKELNGQLADLDVQIRTAGERAVRTLEAEGRIAAGRVDTLTAALDAQKTRVSQSNESEVQLRALDREAKTQRDQLETLLARYREAVARDAENAVPADGRVVSRAVPPLEPSFPRKGPTILLAAVATFALSLGAVIAGELLRNPPPTAGALPAPARPILVAAVENALTKAMSIPTPTSRTGLVAEAVDAWPVDGRGRRFLLLTSAMSQASSEDAIVAAVLPGRSVIVDVPGAEMDAHRPFGLTDLLLGDATFADVIEDRPGGGPAHRIGPGAGSVAELTEDMESLEVALTALEQTYEAVIVVIGPDAPAMLAQALGQRVDHVVVEASSTTSGLVEVFPAARTLYLPEPALRASLAA